MPLSGAFFDAVRPLFGGHLSQAQVDGMTIIASATSSKPTLTA
jgi:hypothetical protein